MSGKKDLYCQRKSKGICPMKRKGCLIIPEGSRITCTNCSKPEKYKHLDKKLYHERVDNGICPVNKKGCLKILEEGKKRCQNCVTILDYREYSKKLYLYRVKNGICPMKRKGCLKIPQEGKKLCDYCCCYTSPNRDIKRGRVFECTYDYPGCEMETKNLNFCCSNCIKYRNNKKKMERYMSEMRQYEYSDCLGNQTGCFKTKHNDDDCCYVCHIIMSRTREYASKIFGFDN